MQVSFLRHLACPRRLPSQGSCGGALAVAPGPLPPREAPESAGELLEGHLACGACGALFPVLAGVAILVEDSWQYLAQRFTSLGPWLALHAELSPAARAWLRQERFQHFHLRPRQDAVDSDPGLHYESVADLFDDPRLPAGFRAFVESTRGRSPYEILAAMAKAAGGKKGLAVDAGCGVGGLAYRLAESCETVIGLDLSFASVLLGREALRGQPLPLEHLPQRQAGELTRRSLDLAPRANVELVVADLLALPLAAGGADLLASANTLEMAPRRPALREVRRVLSRAGTYLVTTPFQFRFGEPDPLTGGADFAESLRRLLAGSGLEPIAEEDWVPWIWYRFDRLARVYFNYCGCYRFSRDP